MELQFRLSPRVQLKFFHQSEIENQTMFHKILKHGIAIHAKSQRSSKIFYKSEIENKTKFQKILKYGIAIHAKSQSSRRNFYKSEIEN